METEEVTVDPPGIYDAFRHAINANVEEPATASRSVPGSRFIRFWKEIKILPAYLSLDPQVFRNQPLITGNMQNISEKSGVLGSNFGNERLKKVHFFS